jgi:hypothetical protein
VFITPNLCHDAHDSPCVDAQPGGLISADVFLKQWVPEILQSPAYKDGGLLAVIFDESATGAEACCNEQSANTPNAGGPSQGPGGGRVGGVLLSSYVQPGSVNTTPYNHYSLLRSVEDLFGLSHLGYAGKSDLKAFGDDVFNARPGGGTPGPSPVRPANCQSTRLRRGTRGRLAPGTLIGTSRIVRRPGAMSVLEVTLVHAATLQIRVLGKAHFKTVHRRVRACHTYNIKLPAGTRQVKLTASVRRAGESRTVSG